MSTRYAPFSGPTRLVAAASAALVTITLLVAVATGVSSEDASSPLAVAPSGHLQILRAA